MKTFSITLCMILSLISSVMAQNNTAVEMADAMRESGKIYVVVAVMSLVFIGIIGYLFSIDKRVKKIEQSK